MADDDNGLTLGDLEVRKTAEGSYYEAGVTVNGAWFPFGTIKSGELEARIGEAADAEKKPE